MNLEQTITQNSEKASQQHLQYCEAKQQLIEAQNQYMNGYKELQLKLDQKDEQIDLLKKANKQLQQQNELSSEPAVLGTSVMRASSRGFLQK